MGSPSPSAAKASASREGEGTVTDDVEVRGFKARESVVESGKTMRVELDKRSLFTLASETRLDILKSLRSSRRTVSQLAELLSIDKAAVHRHLKKLEEGGFVHREKDHGFVYYGLTWKSRGILSPTENTRIVFLLSMSILCLLAITVLIITSSAPAMEAVPGIALTSSVFADGTKPSSLTEALYPAAPIAVFGVAAFALLYSAYLCWKKPRQKQEGADEAGEDLPPVGGPRSA
ncbi:winged helix-turn-helix domain-containing protein [Methanomassiliicoccus luminyensis]|mgnify:CR=1 FL=1|uniref:winged helix-turn-helix domain-containing protein n=1 Tax=Methanomassiliicoccus luminyensis TaxID=1080712 RepID=UPI0003706DCB|nr:winged helix-turn-helix domain-containing protein [Methanomassiliicoccus luminyensis]